MSHTLGSLLARCAALGLLGLVVVPPTSVAAASADCGAVPPNQTSGRSTGDRLLDHPPVSAEERAAIDARTEERLRGRRVPGQDFRGAVIPVHVHELIAMDGTGDLPDEQITQQIAVLNDTFAGRESKESTHAGFRFRLVGVTEYRNDSWHRGGATYAARTAMRQGGSETLNIWTADLPWLLGFATLPWGGAGDDGIVVDFESLPGGALTNYGLGETATHEVGHWLGLWHTFDFGCSELGDSVDDTPAEAVPAYGCEAGRDTCSAPGLDPVHNYMDYGTDLCMDRFTKGQAQRMRDMWLAYRAPSA